MVEEGNTFFIFIHSAFPATIYILKVRASRARIRKRHEYLQSRFAYILKIYPRSFFFALGNPSDRTRVKIRHGRLPAPGHSDHKYEVIPKLSNLLPSQKMAMDDG